MHTEVVPLPHEGQPRRQLRVLVDRPAAAEAPWILIAHGFKGFPRWGFFPELARRLCEAGFFSVRVDFSGNGVGTDGEDFDDDPGFEADTLSRQLEDLDRACAWVTAGSLPGARAEAFGLLGHSRGGGVALLHAARCQDARALVTWAAVDTFDRFDEASKRRWRKDGYLPVPNARTGQVHRLGLALLEEFERDPERYDVIAAARQVSAPTLVVHGSADLVVPVAAAHHIVQALPHPTLLELEGADHTFGARHPFSGTPPPLERALEATVEHFRRALSP